MYIYIYIYIKLHVCIWPRTCKWANYIFTFIYISFLHLCAYLRDVCLCV